MWLTPSIGQLSKMNIGNRIFPEYWEQKNHFYSHWPNCTTYDEAPPTPAVYTHHNFVS